jgi:hypothetical protein
MECLCCKKEIDTSIHGLCVACAEEVRKDYEAMTVLDKCKRCGEIHELDKGLCNKCWDELHGNTNS